MMVCDPGGRPTVLVVEDDALTRAAAVAMLDAAGFDTVEAEDGRAAIIALEASSGIKAMLTDIDLPEGLDGVRLAACVRYRWPAVGVVMVSGKTTPAPGDVPAGARFLPKPYREATVMRVIAGMVTA